MRPLGLFEGKIVDLEENVVPIEERGHVFGDGVYEATEVYKGKLFAFKLHMDRLFYSLREIRIQSPYTYEQLESYHKLLIRETGIENGNIYMQITRGWAPRKHEFPDVVKPRLSMFLRPPSPPPPSMWEEGAHVIMLPDERWLRCDIKSLNLLPNVLAKQRAKEAGCYEALLIRDGKITECSHSNFGIIKDGVIWTHPANHLILRGITRTILIQHLVGPLGIKVNEVPFDVPFLLKADEAFICSTSKNIVPCVKVDGIPIGNGKPGPITRKLLEAFLAYRKNECART
jgi:D-alanine transaminase